MAVASVLAGLGAAASWGAGDYAGGVATRRASVWRVVLVSQAVGVVLTVGLVLALREPMPGMRGLALGAAAGASGAVGIVGLYSALAAGRMGVAAPITAVVGAILPVAVGVLVEGPPGARALVGVALALPGIVLLSRPHGEASPRAVVLALVSGVGFGGFFVLVDAASAAGIGWPLLAARAATLAAVAVVVAARREKGGAATPWGLAALAGLGDTAGNAFFALAATLGRLDEAAVLASIYPAFTVVLARVLLKERLTRGQLAGMALALAAVVLIAS